MLASDRISKTSINSLNIFIFITVYLTCISSKLTLSFLVIFIISLTLLCFRVFIECNNKKVNKPITLNSS